MLALSAAAHMALAIAALVAPPLFGTPLRLEPVAVVDLIGGGEFRQEAGKPPAPTAREDEKPASPAPTPPPARRGKRAKTESPMAAAISRRRDRRLFMPCSGRREGRSLYG